jgi:hypothetical protein
LTKNAAKSIHQGASFSGFFLLAKKLLPDCVHPFQFLKSILDGCDIFIIINPANKYITVCHAGLDPVSSVFSGFRLSPE